MASASKGSHSTPEARPGQLTTTGEPKISKPGQAGMFKTWNPIHNALSFTLFGSLFLVLGLLGCKLRKSPWSIMACTWSDTVLWNEVWGGAAALLVAAYFWRRGWQKLS
jgi:hypothetical protein